MLSCSPRNCDERLNLPVFALRFGIVLNLRSTDGIYLSEPHVISSTDSTVKEDEDLLARRIKEELGDQYKEHPLVLRDQVNVLKNGIIKRLWDPVDERHFSLHYCQNKMPLFSKDCMSQGIHRVVCVELFRFYQSLRKQRSELKGKN